MPHWKKIDGDYANKLGYTVCQDAMGIWFVMDPDYKMLKDSSAEPHKWRSAKAAMDYVNSITR